MYTPQLNTLCDAYRNVNKASLHTAAAGNTGANDSGITHVTVSWSSTLDGRMTALPTFSNVTGTFVEVGLWDDDVFIESLPCQITDVVNQNISILVEHQARVTNGA